MLSMEKRKLSRNYSLEASRQKWGILFILPQLVSLLCFGIIPVIVAFVLSFFDWNGFRGAEFVGLNNFLTVFHEKDTATAIWNTLLYVVVYVPISIALSLGLAMLLNKSLGKMFYRAVFFLPQIVNSVAIAVVWSWIFQPQFGILNSILKVFGLHGQSWLRDPKLAMGSVIAMSVWWGLGYNVVLFLAGLQNVPRVYVEAAQIDGATKVDVFRHVTIPMISPTTLFVAVTTMINAFQAFDQMFLLTNGGPAKRTFTLSIYIYQTAFKEFKLGEASTIALIMFAIVFCISILQFKLSEKHTFYGN